MFGANRYKHTPVETFPAGKYYIGDLCYAIEDWDTFCNLTIKDSECLYGKFPWKSANLWQHGTAYGDGCYNGTDGVKYGVDAGLIGILPIEYADKKDYDLTELGSIVEFDHPFSVHYENGKFKFGHIYIDTDPQDDEEEDEDYSDDEDSY